MNADQPGARALVEQERASLADLSIGYPANHFAWNIVKDAARRMHATTLVEVGVGSGNGVPHVLAEGMSFAGIDIDEGAVQATRDLLTGLDADSNAVIQADIEDAIALDALPGRGTFDLLVGLGILPHSRDENRALLNMASLVRPGGELYVECRNSLFSLVTFNRFTRDLIIDSMLEGISTASREGVREFLDPRLDLNRPPVPSSGHDAMYHNPFEVTKTFRRLGFTDIEIVPFHYHAGMPALEASDPQRFRNESLAMEHETSGWKGLFLCSAFLVKAVAPSPND